MLQDVDHMQASCTFYVEVGRFEPLEHSTICFSTVMLLVIVILTLYHSLMVSM